MTAMLVSLMMTGLAPGSPAPEVWAPNQDGKIVRLEDFQGRPILLFFYPKDDTPGCTREACALRDSYRRYQEQGIVILGISRQDPASHKAFITKHKLPFDLLSDEDGVWAKAFGVKTVPLLGWFKRQSVLLDADHRVVKFFDDVDPAKHAEEVL
ncbi:MAG: peroxiredoxin, partial [Deltaproteobacteria bacterium]|nr:peroxiredoxin [Deltaproteobacteria bacterium]